MRPQPGAARIRAAPSIAAARTGNPILTLKSSHLKKAKSGKATALLLIPGGPGIESSYLQDIFLKMELPNAIWVLDFKTIKNDSPSATVAAWKSDIIRALNYLQRPIVAAHSFGTTFMHSCPGADSLLGGA